MAIYLDHFLEIVALVVQFSLLLLRLRDSFPPRPARKVTAVVTPATARLIMR